jgi:hypothetical protein
MGLKLSKLKNDNINNTLENYSEDAIFLCLDASVDNLRNDSKYNTLFHSQIFRKWLMTSRGEEWLYVKHNINFMCNNISIWECPNISQTQKFLNYCGSNNEYEKYGGSVFYTHKGVKWLSTPNGIRWFTTPNGVKWIETQNMHRSSYIFDDDIFQYDKQYKYSFFANVECWDLLNTSVGIKWIHDNKSWLGTEYALKWLDSDLSNNFKYNSDFFPLFANYVNKKWISGIHGLSWLNSSMGEKFIYSIYGKEWYIDKKYFYDIKYMTCKKWLESEHALKIINSYNNNDFLLSPLGTCFIISKSGISWLKTDKYKWLQTINGKKFLSGHLSWYFLIIDDGITWLETIDGQKWIESYDGQEWLLNSNLINLFSSLLNVHSSITDNYNIDNYKSHNVIIVAYWMSTKYGIKWLNKQSNKIYDKYFFTYFIDSDYSEIWLQSPNCYDFINSEKSISFLTYDNFKWLKTKNGKIWLTTEQAYNNLATDELWEWIISSDGWDWFNTIHGTKFFNSEICKIYIRIKKEYLPLTKKQFAKYFKTENGIKFLYSHNGMLFIEWFKRWITTDKFIKWITTDDGEEFINENIEGYFSEINNPIMGDIIE